MTVQELINKLVEVKNKQLPVVAVISNGMDCDGVTPFIEERKVFEVNEEERCVSIEDKEVTEWVKKELGEVE